MIDGFPRVVLLLTILALMITGCQSTPALPLDWKTRANQDIEKYRKRDAVLTLTDAAGQPVAGATVEIKQTRQAFPFGSAISGAFLRNPQWQQSFLKNFNTAVLENESKWTSNEPRQGFTNYANADTLINWCRNNSIAVRGHCLFYEGSGGQPGWLSGLSPEQLRAALEKRANDATSHFKGKFISWDGNNEMLHGTFFKDRLTDDIRIWMYQRAKQLDLNTPLFTNDFNVLSVDQNFTQVQTDQYVAQVRDLIKRGAPIDGIGIQGHVWREKIWETPEVIRQRLDKVAAIGLPIWISEFDYANPDPKVRADVLELVYRTAYSHPAVHGIMMWVYWAGNNWRASKDGDAALYNRDWIINEEGRRFEQLMAEWTTKLTLVTDARGQVHFRGFHGNYDIASGSAHMQINIIPGPGTQQEKLELH